MQCPICSEPSSREFYLLCTHPEDQRRLAVQAAACEQCFRLIARKEKVLPYFYVPGSGLTLGTIYVAFQARDGLVAAPNRLFLVGGAIAVGLTLLVIGAFVSWRIGDTVLKDTPLKRFAARQSKKHLGLFAPAIQLVTTRPRDAPVIEYSPEPPNSEAQPTRSD